MVKSGLDDEILENNQVPRVSAFRLATHLTCAVTIFAIALRAGLRVRIHIPELTNIQRILEGKALQKLHRYTYRVTAAVFTTALSGRFYNPLRCCYVSHAFNIMMFFCNC